MSPIAPNENVMSVGSSSFTSSDELSDAVSTVSFLKEAIKFLFVK